MPLVLLVVLAPAHLEYGYFLAPSVAEHGGFHADAGDHRLAKTHALAVTANHQHLIDHDFGADIGRELLDLQLFAGSDLVLLAAGFDDRIHKRNSRESPRATEAPG